MSQIKKDKRGDIFQLPYLIVLILAIAIIGLIIGFLAWKITQAYGDMQQIQDVETARLANEKIGAITPNVIDWTILFFFLFGTMGLVIGAVRTNFSIIMVGLFIILLLLSIYIASQSANIYQGLAQDPTIQPFSQQLTFTNILFSKFTPMIIVIIGGFLLIVMYGKSGGSIPV